MGYTVRNVGVYGLYFNQLNKWYVGCSMVSVAGRMNSHGFSKHTANGTKLGLAIKNNPKESIERHILFQVPINIQQQYKYKHHIYSMFQFETAFQMLLDSVDNGLNEAYTLKPNKDLRKLILNIRLHANHYGWGNTTGMERLLIRETLLQPRRVQIDRQCGLMHEI